jgi:GT2 family glycosyltransferase
VNDLPPAPRITHVAIVTVTYNSGGDAIGALRSAAASAVEAGLTAQLVAVDNASLDGSADMVEADVAEARVVRRATNDGFGVANNEAFALVSADAFMLLNPDARLDARALGRLAEVLSFDPRAGFAAPSIRGPGSVESAGMHPSIRSLLAHYAGLNRLIPGGGRGPWRGFSLPARSTPEPVPVDWASGAAILIRADAVRRTGGFDPTIFLYGEDIDFCKRIRAEGYGGWLVPGAVATHAIGGSSDESVSTRWIDGLHRVYAKDGGPMLRARLTAFDLVLAAGLGVRAIAAGVASRVRPGDGRVALAAHRARLAKGAARALRLAAGARPR